MNRVRVDFALVDHTTLTIACPYCEDYEVVVTLRLDENDDLSGQCPACGTQYTLCDLPERLAAWPRRRKQEG